MTPPAPMEQDEITFEGVKYVPVDDPSCEGCAFDIESNRCVKVACTDYSREDGRSVIWVKAEDQPK